MVAHPLLALGLPQGGELGDQLIQADGSEPRQLGERRSAVLRLALRGRVGGAGPGRARRGEV
jgi:hypothetical protein